MVTAALKCPFCGSEDVGYYGASNGKSGMPVIILNVPTKHFTPNTTITGASLR
jgi:hypothetical protein